MNAMSRNALKAYNTAETEIATDSATPHQLILMLYDGAIQAVAKSKFAIRNNDIPAKCKAITHAYSIIQEGLQLSLDTKVGGDVAMNLNDLYEYMCDRLLIANARNDIDALDEVGRLLSELRGAWAAIGVKQSQPLQQNAIEPLQPQRAVSLSYGAA